jgi:hypothetical protein
MLQTRFANAGSLGLGRLLESRHFPKSSAQRSALLLQAPHKINALCIVHNLQQDPVLLHPGLGALKCGVFTELSL